MSGGIGPCSDIHLPKEESTEEAGKPLPPRRRFFTFRQLNVLAVMIVLSASGMVSIEDLGFVLFSIIYLYFISEAAFPQTNPPWTGSVFGQTNRTLRLYMLTAAVIGLLLPLAYIFEGIVEGDKEGVKAAVPHLFLLGSQVFMEGVASTDRFSLPVRVFVPVSYNAKRIFTLAEWLRSEISKDQKRRLYVGRGLAVANMAFWCFNLFGFLVPVYLPKAFKIYYSNHKHNKD
nr:Interleukin-16 like [Ipomoea batatas]